MDSRSKGPSQGAAEEPSAGPRDEGTQNPGEVTGLLSAWQAGDARAADDLLALVYRELRKLANAYLRRERQGHTLQPTALVNEAYLRLSGPGLEGARVENRSHFFAIAAKAMRRVLVDHARRHQADKRIGAHQKVALDDGPMIALATAPDHDILAIHLALRKLEEAHPRQARVIELRFFGGLSETEVATALDISRATVAREWKLGRALLLSQLKSDSPDTP